MALVNELIKAGKRPGLYEKGNVKLWEDPHISKGMLEAHLSPDDDAATRKHTFIDASVEWIVTIAPPEHFPKLIDFGCGPGMYTSRLAKKGYEVTGVDISENSIRYAKEKALETGNKIDYRVLNYLTFNETEVYDVAILIYCDYGALSDAERCQILDNAYRALKPGGKLIFDVFTPMQYTESHEERSFSIYEKGGFYKAEPHICLYSHLKYGENVWLDQYLLLDEHDQLDVIQVWDTFFTLASLTDEAEAAGFKVAAHFGDVAGKPYSEDSETLCVVLEKG